MNDPEIPSEIKSLGERYIQNSMKSSVNQEMFMIDYFYKFGDIRLPKCDFFHKRHDVPIPAAGRGLPDPAATHHPHSKAVAGDDCSVTPVPHATGRYALRS